MCVILQLFLAILIVSGPAPFALMALTVVHHIPDFDNVSPSVHVCSDGSTAGQSTVDESDDEDALKQGFIGAGACLRGLTHGISTADPVSCSYFGTFTGGEQAEHVGLTCALHVISRCSSGTPFIVHMDNWNAAARYNSGAVLVEDMAYLEPLVQLNTRRLADLARRGYVVSLRWFAREFNDAADRLAGLAREAAEHSGIPSRLLQPGGHAPDFELSDALAQSSRLLRDRGPYNKNRVRRQRLRAGLAAKTAAMKAPFPSRYNPQPEDVATCACVCQVCHVNRCDFRCGHGLSAFLQHECWDCHHDLTSWDGV